MFYFGDNRKSLLSVEMIITVGRGNNSWKAARKLEVCKCCFSIVFASLVKQHRLDVEFEIK